MSNITLRLTCRSHPEQYDAFQDGEQVGYLRLRHGEFRVHAPSYGADLLYEASPEVSYTVEGFA